MDLSNGYEMGDLLEEGWIRGTNWDRRIGWMDCHLQASELL